jgi:hypothetical protein
VCEVLGFAKSSINFGKAEISKCASSREAPYWPVMSLDQGRGCLTNGTRLSDSLKHLLIFIMAGSTKKRTLDAFFKPPPKKLRVSEVENTSEVTTESTEDRVGDRSVLGPNFSN